MPLYLPFETDILSRPSGEQKWLAAGLTDVPNAHWKDHLDIHMPWRPDYLNLTNAGFQCFPEWSDKADYDGGILELGKHKGLNQNRFLSLVTRIKAGGTIVVSGDKTAGSAPMLKWIKSFLDVEDKLSKNHGIVFWLRVPLSLNIELMTKFQHSEIEFSDNFFTAAGMFSHGRIDPGSEMLIKHINKIAFGRTADFGSGWGYLTRQILQVSDKITMLDSYEADFAALEMAKRNIVIAPENFPLTFHWSDLTREPISEIYDTIISNPPFHTGRSTNVSLGQRFIEVAAQRLKIGGCLLLVANRQLPYEMTIKSLFRKVFVLEDAQGYKIIEARK